MHIPLEESLSYTKRFGCFKYYVNRRSFRHNVSRLVGCLWTLLTLGLLRGVVELELR
jgi:hypothetical protein